MWNGWLRHASTGDVLTARWLRLPVVPYYSFVFSEDRTFGFMTSTYYITTPIYYVNGLPHVGSALTTIACDVLARYHQMLGEKSWMLTGTDENATKVQEAAQKAGVTPQAFVDHLATEFRSSWNSLHIDYSDFIRTSEPRHIRACQEFFKRLMDNGYVYLDTYEGWYSVSDETFFLDDKVKDGFEIETGKPVVRVQEKNYFFKLSAFGDRLLEYYQAHPEFLQPEFRKNEVIGFVKEGLRDMCITRTNKGWGIEVPGDPDRVIYVWFDALINYLAATGWPDDPNWEQLWPPKLHLMGKEIFVRFHATLWPAMLMALGVDLPEQVFAHGWWTARGSGGKLGKSTGGLPTPEKFTTFLAQKALIEPEIAADAQRYILCREMNFGLDTDFSMDNCLRRYNSDLANDLGNLLNRSINMLVKYCDGVVPQAEADTEITALAEHTVAEYRTALNSVSPNRALEAIWSLIGRLNKYVDEKAPWTLARQRDAGDAAAGAALNTVLYACLETSRIASVLLWPFMPVASGRLATQLGLAPNVEAPSMEYAAWGGLPAETRVASPTPIFPRIQTLELTEAELIDLGVLLPTPPEAKERQSKVSDTTPAPGTPIAPDAVQPEPDPIITIDDLMKVQLRIGEVLAAEPVPNASKLLRLTVQLGEDDTRTILAGVAEYYQPEALVGRQVVVVANLAPRKMRGIESQGMLLAADIDGKAVLLQPDSPVAPGARVR
jgi:methionyl-tRNA synthetase